MTHTARVHCTRGSDVGSAIFGFGLVRPSDGDIGIRKVVNKEIILFFFFNFFLSE
jgi:hypothetical protein